MISLRDAFGLLRKYGLPRDRIRHSIGVAKFAHDLAGRIQERHPRLTINPATIRLAALLHDIGRSRPGDHEINSRHILRDEGCDELAALVMHGTAYEKFLVRGQDRPELIPATIENKIVAYADARFRMSPVTLEERIADIKRRRSAQSEKMASVRLALPRIQAMEQELLALAGLPAPGRQQSEAGGDNAMQAACVSDGVLRLCKLPLPNPATDEVLIRVTLAGICNTDHEILRGYVPGFDGIPGHEFVGIVERSPDPSLIDKRVTAEINCACGACDWCRQNLQRHCPHRSVLGIANRNGALAEYTAAPRANVYEIPDWMSDTQAVFIEPLAAALEILDQVTIEPAAQTLLIGDGKLALLIASVLRSTGCALTVVGKHAHKLAFAESLGARTICKNQFEPASFDIVVEATGHAEAFEMAVACVKPRGTIVLKSTYAGSLSLNASILVVNEITVIGSRCGRFEAAIDFLKRERPPLEKLVSATVPLCDIDEAFALSEASESLKVLVNTS